MHVLHVLHVLNLLCMYTYMYIVYRISYIILLNFRNRTKSNKHLTEGETAFIFMVRILLTCFGNHIFIFRGQICNQGSFTEAKYKRQARPFEIYILKRMETVLLALCNGRARACV